MSHEKSSQSESISKEYRMKASDFAAVLRRALGAPPLPERKKKAEKKPRKKSAPNKE